MPEIKIRPAIETDIPTLISMDHSYVTDYVWQMDAFQQDEEVAAVRFRSMRLPRSASVSYPRSPEELRADWMTRPIVLVAELDSLPVGYVSVSNSQAPRTAWITDLAVARRVRRQGIGAALVLAVETWAAQHGATRLVLEMQPKNYPAICLAEKLGFSFSGYSDRYFVNQDIAIFFARTVRAKNRF
jgi:ribosomal protein S18 acetylase RimI-like enzyme